MAWSIRLGDEKHPMWLNSVDDDEVRFTGEPRKFRSKSYAERMLKQARKIVPDNVLTLIEE